MLPFPLVPLTRHAVTGRLRISQIPPRLVQVPFAFSNHLPNHHRHPLALGHHLVGVRGWLNQDVDHGMLLLVTHHHSTVRARRITYLTG